MKTKSQNSSHQNDETKGLVFKNASKFLSHLYKLLPAPLKTNVSFTEDPFYVEHPHGHNFRTTDSDGRPQAKTCMVGGHFHYVTLTPQKNGPPLVELSGPKKEVKKKVQGRWTKILADMPDDNHKHEVQYVHSQWIHPRKLNEESMKVQNHVANKESGVENISPDGE